GRYGWSEQTPAQAAPPRRPREYSGGTAPCTSVPLAARSWRTDRWRGKPHSTLAVPYSSSASDRAALLPCQCLVERKDTLRADPTPALAPILAVPVVRWRAQAHRESSLLELVCQSCHGLLSAAVSIQCQYHAL